VNYLLVPAILLFGADGIDDGRREARDNRMEAAVGTCAAGRYLRTRIINDGRSKPSKRTARFRDDIDFPLRPRRSAFSGAFN